VGPKTGLDGMEKTHELLPVFETRTINSVVQSLHRLSTYSDLSNIKTLEQ